MGWDGMGSEGMPDVWGGMGGGDLNGLVLGLLWRGADCVGLGFTREGARGRRTWWGSDWSGVRREMDMEEDLW